MLKPLDRGFMGRLAALLAVGAAIWGYFAFNANRVKPGVDLAAAQSFFPAARQVAPRIDLPGVYSVWDQRQQVIGHLITTSPWMDANKGYAGPVPLLIAIDTRDLIQGIRLLPNHESDDFIRRLTGSGLLQNWVGMNWRTTAQTARFDAVAGATLSSQAAMRSLQGRLAMLQHGRADLAPRFHWLDLIALLLMLAGVLLYFPPWILYPPLRTGYMVLCIIYLGFIRGNFLSIALFANWLKFGIPLASMWLLAVMALLALAVPLIAGKAFYCRQVCPFGNLQELVNRYSPWLMRAWPLPAGLVRFRQVMLALMVLLLLLDQGIDLARFEPFTAFWLKNAEAGVVLLAAISLLLAFFYPRPWCRYLCPTGALLDCFINPTPGKQQAETARKLAELQPGKNLENSL